MSLLERLVTYAHWYRRPLAMVCAAAAVVAGVGAAQERTDGTAPVLVAVHTVQPGVVVGADDVTVRTLPRGAIPHDALRTPGEAVGKVATAGASSGTPLTVYSVATPKLTHGSGRVLAPLRIADADIAGYLNPGDVIDVVSATEASAQTVAHRAQVIALPQTAKTALGGSDSRGVLVIVAVTLAEATALAQASAAGRLTISLT